MYLTCDKECHSYTAMGEKEEHHSDRCLRRQNIKPYIARETLESLIREAIEAFNDGLNIGLGWVARAERLLDERE